MGVVKMRAPRTDYPKDSIGRLDGFNALTHLSIVSPAAFGIS